MFTLVITIFLILTFILLLVKNLNDLSNIVRNNNAAAIANTFPGSQNSLLKHDCNHNVVYSVEDSQCNMICKPPGTYISRNGVCIDILAFNHSTSENECSPKHGVLAYLIGDPQFGTTNLFCLSIDIGVQPDDIHKANTLCQNGNIDIDYLESFPQLASCKCPDNTFLALISNNNNIRTRGICVDNDNRPFYENSNLVYDANNV